MKVSLVKEGKTMTGKFKNVTAMLIFGSVGIFVKNISLSSGGIAFLRGVIGCTFLIIISLMIKQRFSIESIKRNMKLLILSGTAVGLNWILLFQAYKYTTVSNATLSYYFAPVFIMILSPFVLKEKLTKIKAGCIIVAMTGLFLIVNIGGSSIDGSYDHLIGIMYGLSAAVLYAGAVLLNKFIKNLSGLATTLVQLMISALVLAPYVFMIEPINFAELNLQSLSLILILGILHTGTAYFLYFTSLQELNGQTIAILSYIDPISAVIMASLFLGERMGFMQIIGGILILGSTFVSERLESRVSRDCQLHSGSSIREGN